MKQDIDKGPESVTDGNQSTVNSDSRPGCPHGIASKKLSVYLIRDPMFMAARTWKMQGRCSLAKTEEYLPQIFLRS